MVGVSGASFFDQQTVNAIFRLVFVLTLQRDDFVAMVGDVARHIYQGLVAFEPHFNRLARFHAFDQEFGFDESHGADLINDIDKKVGVALLVHLETEYLDTYLNLYWFFRYNQSRFKGFII